jgi:hypothetical protein
MKQHLFQIALLASYPITVEFFRDARGMPYPQVKLPLMWTPAKRLKFNVTIIYRGARPCGVELINLLEFLNSCKKPFGIEGDILAALSQFEKQITHPHGDLEGLTSGHDVPPYTAGEPSLGMNGGGETASFRQAESAPAAACTYEQVNECVRRIRACAAGPP